MLWFADWFADQLLNQLDGAGPPPASKDQIDALPMTTIVQEQVGQWHCLSVSELQ